MNIKGITKKLEKFFDLKMNEIFIFGACFLVLIGIVIYYFGVPFYKYQVADAAGKCAIDLRNKNDNDAFCDSNNKLQSKTGVAKKEEEKQTKLAEEARRAALTPKQRCEEDNKNFSNEDGEPFYVFCKEDGTYETKSAEELESELERDMQEVQQEDNCDPNYSPCVPNVSYDLDCPDIGFTVRVIGTDVHNFDRDGDGYGCEPY